MQVGLTMIIVGHFNADLSVCSLCVIFCGLSADHFHAFVWHPRVICCYQIYPDVCVACAYLYHLGPGTLTFEILSPSNLTNMTKIPTIRCCYWNPSTMSTIGRLRRNRTERYAGPDFRCGQQSGDGDVGVNVHDENVDDDTQGS